MNTVSVNICFHREMKVLGSVVDCSLEAWEPMSSTRDPSEPNTKLPVDMQLERLVSSSDASDKTDPSVH